MTIRRQRIAVWYDDESRKLRRLSRMLERRYRRTGLPSDRLNWVLQEKERHRINRIKENAYWLTCISSHSGQPRKLWRTFSTIMGLDKAGSLPISGPTAQLRNSMIILFRKLKIFVGQLEILLQLLDCHHPQTSLVVLKPTAPVKF